MPKPLIADKPYPTTEGITPDCRALRIISPAYAASAGELTATLQYIYHAINFENKNKEEYASIIEQIAIAEMTHLKLLGNTIYALGAQPVYTAFPPAAFNFYSAKFVSYSCSLKNMLEDDIIAEKQAISSYERMIERLRNDKVKCIIERILEDEKLHLAVFRELLAKLSD